MLIKSFAASSNNHKIRQLLESLKSTYGFDLGSASVSQLNELGEKYTRVKKRIIAESDFNSYTKDPRYTKAVLILEAVKLLVEIAPKRTRKKSPMKESVKIQEKAAMKKTYKKGDRVHYKGEECDVVKFVKGADDNDPTNDVLGIMHKGKMKIVPVSDVKPCKEKVNEAVSVSSMQPYEYQASMARSELYRNIKYATAMMHMIRAEDEIQPWIAASLTKAANYLDKIYHYLDYYVNFEPEQLPEGIDSSKDMDLGETSGSIARQNLMMIVEYSTKLFEMIEPGDHLEGWVAMKLTTASDCISSSKHYMEYAHFEKHAMVDDHFDESRRAKRREVAETIALLEDENLEHAQTILAAKDISDRLQKMAEEAAKMSVDDLMPLVDVMKEQFGLEKANDFNKVVKEKLQAVLDAVMDAKDQTDNAIMVLQGHSVPDTSDIAKPESPPAPAPAQTPSVGDGDEKEGDGSEDIDFEKEFEKDFQATPATSGEKENPLGRSKKSDLAESMETCMECGVGTYMEDNRGRMRCDECGHTMIVSESDSENSQDTKFHTYIDFDKIIPGLTGYCLAKAGNYVLMHEEEGGRNIYIVYKKVGNEYVEAEKFIDLSYEIYSEGKAIKKFKEKYLTANGEVINHPDPEKVSIPVYTPTQSNTNKPSPVSGHKPTKTTVYSDKILFNEAVIGAQNGAPKPTNGAPKPTNSAQKPTNGAPKPTNSAQKPTNGAPKPTTKLPKGAQKQAIPTPTKTSPKGTLEEKSVSVAQQRAAGIAFAAKKHKFPEKKLKGASKAMFKMSMKELEKFATTKHKGLPEKVDEQIQALNEKNRRLDIIFGKLSEQFAKHIREFNRQLNEGKQIDPLNVGYGLEGEAIVEKMNRVIFENTKTNKQITTLLNEKQKILSAEQATSKQLRLLDQKLSSSPWGVVGKNQEGKVVKKFFETQSSRSMWLEYNELKESKMIDPSTIKNARNYLSKK